MTTARFEVLPITVTNPAGLPKSYDFESLFSAEASLLAWFDFADATTVTTASGNLSSILPRVGQSGYSLDQATAGNRPAYDAVNGQAVFDAASTEFMVGSGAFPTDAVTVALVLERAATATTTEGVIGSTSPATGSHSMFFQANGEIRFRVTDGTETTFEEPESPTPTNNQAVLVTADYSHTTDQARCRINNGAAGTSIGPAGANITMNTDWYLGALTSGGGSPANMRVSDVFLFDSALIGQSIIDRVYDYAVEFKNV